MFDPVNAQYFISDLILSYLESICLPFLFSLLELCGLEREFNFRLFSFSLNFEALDNSFGVLLNEKLKSKLLPNIQLSYLFVLILALKGTFLEIKQLLILKIMQIRFHNNFQL
jgi:hypothetical protein